MILKQSIKNHFYVLRFTFITTFLFGVGWIYFNFDPDYFKVVGIFIMTFTLPALYLHIEYAIRNAGVVIDITPEKVIVKNNNTNKEYKKSDIIKIIVYKSASLDRQGIPFSQMEYYHFARLITSSGEEIIITCLMCKNVNEVVNILHGVPNVRKKGFCTTFWK